jgi:hypothetical protein
MGAVRGSAADLTFDSAGRLEEQGALQTIAGNPADAH